MVEIHPLVLENRVTDNYCAFDVPQKDIFRLAVYSKFLTEIVVSGPHVFSVSLLCFQIFTVK